MGFAFVRQRVTPKPKAKNTVVCENCHAEYSPHTQWVRGYRRDPTSTALPNFEPVALVPKGVCPVCDHPAQHEEQVAPQEK